ncbi:MAG: hypothetical protein AAF975_08705, partial [Spirochaetota bacterium]
QDIVTKLIFINYRNSAGKAIHLDAENFINEEELRNFVFMGDSVTKSKIDTLMREVSKESRSLPLSLHKYAAQTLQALYQFQKISYFPYSNFFNTFRTEVKRGNHVYSSILPQDAYDSVHLLYQLINEVGEINFEKETFREIISSYFNIVEHKNPIGKTAVHLLEAFSDLQTIWNTFVQKTPVDLLLLFVSENPYLNFPPVENIKNEILGSLPRQIEKVYQQSVQENIEKMAGQLRENRTKYFYAKYLSHTQFTPSAFYNNKRQDLMPSNHSPESNNQSLFAHCESFAYAQNFLHYFCKDNILKPLSVLIRGVFNSNNYVYNYIVEFLSEMERHKQELNLIDQDLQPENRKDTEIKEILIRIEQRSEGARDEYTTFLINIDQEIRSRIEAIVEQLEDFANHGLPAIEHIILEDSYYQKFNSFLPQFHYMHDFNNPDYAPLTPATTLE